MSHYFWRYQNLFSKGGGIGKCDEPFFDVSALTFIKIGQPLKIYLLIHFSNVIILKLKIDLRHIEGAMA